MMRQEYLFEADGKRYGYSHVLDSLKELGITRGSTLFVHSDLKSFGKILPGTPRETYLDAFVEALAECLGSEGNLIMPTFTYSFCSGSDYDPETTPSTVGVLTEHFRKRPGVKRSRDPLFSAAALGPRADYFCDTDGEDSFGKNSIFEKIYRAAADLVFLGDTFDITFMHYPEQAAKVSYRYPKNFSGRVKAGGEWHARTVTYNVRSMDGSVNYDLAGLAAKMDAAGILRRTRLGYGQLRKANAKDAYKNISDGLSKDERYLQS